MSKYISLLLIVAVVCVTTSIWAQETDTGAETTAAEKSYTVEKLWPNGTPGAVGEEEADIPTLTIYLPPADQANGAAVLICPGGGYGHIAIDHEGHAIAQWLNKFGVAGIILKYRIAPRYHHPAPSQDALYAMKTVRSKAAEWNIDPNRIGIMGFSAGGHLASTVGTHFDYGDPSSTDPIEHLGSRPNFMILVYPVVTFFNDYTHRGSRKNLLGENPSADMIRLYSNETQVGMDTPPTFLIHTLEDKAVPVENSLQFYRALRNQSVPSEMHVFEKGPHGFGLAPGNPVLSIWPTLCENWLRQLGLLEKK